MSWPGQGRWKNTVVFFTCVHGLSGTLNVFLPFLLLVVCLVGGLFWVFFPSFSGFDLLHAVWHLRFCISTFGLRTAQTCNK